MRSKRRSLHDAIVARCRQLDRPGRAPGDKKMVKPLEFSPADRLLFTSDYQFGPDTSARFGPITLGEFLELPARTALGAGAIYQVAPR